MCKFGETVMIKGLNAQNKPVWRKGFWLGKSELNDAAFVVTKVGSITGRAVMRLPDSPMDVRGLYEMRGTPWRTGGARDVPTDIFGCCCVTYSTLSMT